MAGDRAPGAAELLPDAGLPLRYFVLAHVSLGLASLQLVVQPGSLVGHHYNAPVFALVHLVTLGWITSSILGAFYIVAPLVLGMPFQARRVDRVLFWLYALAASGVVSHFWLNEYSGMAWSGGLILIVVGVVALRAWWGLPRAKAPWPVKAHVGLAFANLLAAGCVGVVMGTSARFRVFEAPPLMQVSAHAHLAAVGFATLLFTGCAYRMLPMLLPARTTTGRSMTIGVVLMQAGLVGITVRLLSGEGAPMLLAVVVAFGLAVFGEHVVRMLGARLPPPAALPRPDWATRQVRSSLVYLVVAVLLGLTLTTDAGSRWMTELAWAYGIAGLLGFIGQAIAGVQGRLLPIHAWYRALQARRMEQPERSAHELGDPRLQLGVAVSWNAAVVLLGAGFVTGRPWLVAGGGLALGAAALLGAAHLRQAIVRATESARPA